MNGDVRLTRSQRDTLEVFFRELGEVPAAAALGVSRNTLMRALGGGGVRPSKAAAILAFLTERAAKMNTGGDEATRQRGEKMNTRTSETASALGQGDAEEHGGRAMRKLLIPVDADLARAIEERRRAVPLDRPVPPVAEIVRALLRAGLAATPIVTPTPKVSA